MKEFKRYYTIPATPEEVYAALTNPVTLELWTGEPAVMTTEPGSEFSLWDGSITGRNIEFEAGKKLVQEWYFGDQPEASIVTIRLHKKETTTSAEVEHINIPDEAYDEIADGWTRHYFKPLIRFYED